MKKKVMMLINRNIELPKYLLKKMSSLRKDNKKIFFYLQNEVIAKHFADKTLPLIGSEINGLKFFIYKKNEQYVSMEAFLQSEDKMLSYFIDPEGIIRHRMEYHYKFDSDLDFVLTFLYFITKINRSSFILISDDIFEKNIITTKSDLITDKTDIDIVKTITIELSI